MVVHLILLLLSVFIHHRVRVKAGKEIVQVRVLVIVQERLAVRGTRSHEVRNSDIVDDIGIV